MSAPSNVLEVWLCDDLGPARPVGTLAHDRGQIRFHYERDWLKDPRAFALDPDLSLDEHPTAHSGSASSPPGMTIEMSALGSMSSTNSRKKQG